MSIKNEPRITNPIIVAIREQLEHRALWMYLLCDEAAKRVLRARNTPPTPSSAAVFIRVQISAKRQAAANPERAEKDPVF